jgi:hypothetical protein
LCAAGCTVITSASHDRNLSTNRLTDTTEARDTSSSIYLNFALCSAPLQHMHMTHTQSPIRNTGIRNTGIRNSCRLTQSAAMTFVVQTPSFVRAKRWLARTPPREATASTRAMHPPRTTRSACA